MLGTVLLITALATAIWHVSRPFEQPVGHPQQHLHNSKSKAPGIDAFTAPRPDIFTSPAIAISQLEQIKLTLFGSTVGLLRILAAAVMVLGATIVAVVHNYCVAKQWLRGRELSMSAIVACSRAYVWLASFMSVKTIGRVATAEEAPICISNHISLMETIYLTGAHVPRSTVAKKEVFQSSGFGIIMRALQCIPVDRFDPMSRQKVAAQIIAQAKDPNALQVLVFAEGTCTNGSGLLPFRLGAFAAGCPVQPVVVKYQANHCHPALVPRTIPPVALLVRLFFQPSSQLEVHYLPVVTPTDAEKQNAQLFAERVHGVMRDYLQVQPCPQSSADLALCNLASSRGFDPLVGELGMARLKAAAPYLTVARASKMLDLYLYGLKRDNAARPKWGPTAGLQRKHFQRILQDFPLADGSTATAPQLNALYEFVAGAGSDELSFSAFCYCILALWDKEPAKGVLQQAVLLQRSSD